MMIGKQLVTAGAAFLLLLGGFMSAAKAMDDITFTQEATPWRFAEELFGARASAVGLGGATGAFVDLTVKTDGVSGDIPAAGGVEATNGGTATFEFRLVAYNDSNRDGLLDYPEEANDAVEVQFARNLEVDALDFMESEQREGGKVNPEIQITRTEDGLQGDSSVSFRVVARRPDTTSSPNPDLTLAIRQGDKFRLTVPGVQNIPQGFTGNVGVVVFITPGETSAPSNFRSAQPLRNGGSAGNSIVSNNLIETVDAITLNADVAAPLPTINVDMRERFATSAAAVTRAGSTEQLPGARIGLLSYTENADARDEDNGPFTLDSRDRFLISVTGDFHENAFVFADLNGDRKIGESEIIPDEGLSLSATGETARMLLDTSLPAGMQLGRSVYLVSDGETELVPNDVLVTMALNYADAEYLDETPANAGFHLTFQGIAQDGFAYAIPNCTQTDRARIRVTNETNEPITLFVQGTDQEGADLGLAVVDARDVRGGESSRLAANETLVMFSQHVEQVFGLNDGQYDKDTRCTASETWSGRAQLSFFASGNITVTPLIRGTDGQLRDLGGFTGLLVGEPGTDQDRIGR